MGLSQFCKKLDRLPTSKFCLQKIAHDYCLKRFCLFIIRERWEKVNVTWLENGKQVSYGQNKTYFFRRDLSVAGEETMLTLPNLPMLVSRLSHSSTRWKMVFFQENDNFCNFLSFPPFEIFDEFSLYSLPWHR